MKGKKGTASLTLLTACSVCDTKNQDHVFAQHYDTVFDFSEAVLKLIYKNKWSTLAGKIYCPKCTPKIYQDER